MAGQRSPYMNVMVKAAEKASRSLARDFGEVEQLQVSRKGPGDFVSAADKRAEEIIYEEISRAYPKHSFIMEESGVKEGENKEYRWIIDPLDGTTNFLHGVPHWCISIALEHQGEVVAGLIQDPVKDEVFTAEKNQGAFLQRKRLRVSGRKLANISLVLTGAPHKVADRNQFFNEYRAVSDTGATMRRYGSAALDLAYVAAGRAEGFWERGLNTWDVAAGMLIIKEAGGFISSLDNKKLSPHLSGDVLAGNEFMHQELQKVLKTA